LQHLTEQIRKQEVYGERPVRTFNEAALKYLKDQEESEEPKATMWQDAYEITGLRPFIGHLPLEQIHMGSLQQFVKKRRKDGVKARTINAGLQVVRHILNLASGEWIDENGMTWLHSPPKIKFLPEDKKRKRKPYPLSWEEQDRLFAELPDHLRRMAEFKVNTGCRMGEVCGLKWDYELEYPALNTSVFVIPGEHVKNRDDRVVVLNRIAKDVIEEVRGVHPEYVFSFKGRPVRLMNSTAWKKARIRAGLRQVRIHDLKHTFGRRLRAAEVPEEDRKDLLGHRSGCSMTTHYSMAELAKLIAYANRVCEGERHNSDTIVFLEKRNRQGAAV
jgi:integrase